MDWCCKAILDLVTIVPKNWFFISSPIALSSFALELSRLPLANHRQKKRPTGRGDLAARLNLVAFWSVCGRYVLTSTLHHMWTI